MQQFLARAGGLVLGLGCVLLPTGPAFAVISRPTPLAGVIKESQFIFTAKVDKLAPDKPGVVLVVDEDLKDKAPFRRLPVNLRGDKEAEKGEHTAKLLKRLAPSLPLVVFVYASERGGYIAFAYTNGTWFQMIAQKAEDPAGSRWAFTHGEPYLRRTFKDGTAELRQLIVDTLAGKKTPPAPDLKVEPGFGPEVPPAEAPKPGGPAVAASGTLAGSEEARKRDACGYGAVRADGPLFAVIPTVLVAGPLAILALLFPTVFGGLALFFRRWLVVLSVVSLNSTLFVLHGWLSPWFGDAWYGTPLALWTALTLLTLAGLLWSWRRQPTATPADVPRGREYAALWVASLLGLAFVGLCLLRRAPLLDDSWRKPALVLWVGVWAGTLYALYLRRAAGRQAALPAEGVMLAGMVAGCTALGLTTLPHPAAGAGEVVTSGGRQAVAAGARPVGVVWKFQAPKAGWVASSPLVASDRVYLAAAQGGVFEKYGTLYCLDRATGKPVWTFDNDKEMKQVFSTPCLSGGRLYVGEGFHEDNGCKLYCLDAATGKKQWEFVTNSHTESSPCVAGGKVYCGAGDDGLLCLNAASGKKVWDYPGLHVDCNPVVAGKRVYAGSGVGDTYRETCLFCLEADTGKEVWRTGTDLPVWGSPTVAGQHLFVGLGNGNFETSGDRPAGAVLCLDAATGYQAWRADVPDAVLNRLALDRHRVYFGSRDGNCYCLDRLNGQVRWKHDLGSPVVTAPVPARSPGSSAVTAVYALGSGGRACCLDPDTGTPDWTFDVAGDTKGKPKLYSSPAVVVTHEGGGERRLLYFGAGIESPLGMTALLYCHEDRLEDQ
jgi:outer membrane protein assembly factor BamB